MTQPIWYDSTETGAPTLNNAAGSLLEVLRSCLVNGFNTRVVTSIAVASGVATATAAAHGFSGTFGKLVQISGAPEALLNGRKQPGNVLTNSFTFPAPGVADGTYTGTISARRAPLGWLEAHTGANRAIFQRSAPEASGQLLRVVDTAAAPTDARAQCVETATGVDAFTGVAPALADGFFWWKGANTAAAKRWAVVGDGRFLYLFTDLSGSSHYRAFVFGDAVSFRAADGYPTLIAGMSSANAAAGLPGWTGSFLLLSSTATQDDIVISRAHTQLGGALRVGLHGFGQQGIGGVGPAYPGPVANGCVIAQPVFIGEAVAGGNDIRGVVPGLAQPIATRPFAALQVVQSLIGTNRAFLAVPLLQSNGGQMLVDLTGPWY
jgi:hypothetical protein